MLRALSSSSGARLRSLLPARTVRQPSVSRSDLTRSGKYSLQLWAKDTAKLLTPVDKLSKIERLLSQQPARPVVRKQPHKPERRILREILGLYNSNCSDFKAEKPAMRREYVMIHLEGASGAGKSAACQNLVEELRGFDDEESAFPAAEEFLAGPIIVAYVDFNPCANSSDRLMSDDIAAWRASGQQFLSLRFAKGSLPEQCISRPAACNVDGATAIPAPAAEPPCAFVLLDEMQMIPDQAVSLGLTKREASTFCMQFQHSFAAYCSQDSGTTMAPCLQAGIMMQPIMAGTGLGALRKASMLCTSAPWRSLVLAPLPPEDCKAALRERLLLSGEKGWPSIWKDHVAVLDKLMNHEMFLAVIEMCGGLPRLSVAWFADVLRTDTRFKRITADLSPLSDMTQPQAEALILPLLDELKARAGDYFRALGPGPLEELIGGDPGLLTLLLLAATGRPVALDTRLLGRKRGPSISQAAITGLFTLQEVRAHEYTVHMPGLVQWLIARQLDSHISGITDIQPSWLVPAPSVRLEGRDFEMLIASLFQAASRVDARLHGLRQTTLQAMLPEAISSQPHEMTTELRVEERTLARDEHPMMESFREVLVTGQEVWVSRATHDPSKPSGEAHKQPFLDTKSIVLLDGIDKDCAAFDIRLVLRQLGSRRPLLVLLDIDCTAPGRSSRILEHLKSHAVITSRRAVMQWAQRLKCDVCFLVVHLGSSEGVAEYLSSPDGQAQQYFTVVVTEGALSRLVPAIQSRPSLLTAYAPRERRFPQGKDMQEDTCH
ncbi:hypothetical protein WJX73_000617 [Symbiochloris irregularis]|uniref:Uncharacterized protein n=1 Tax=Symbiochloris irregularis TaxID=706552 RepID=A0AAW1NLJ5_9CHLO